MSPEEIDTFLATPRDAVLSVVFDADIGAAARHYLEDGADAFVARIEQSLAAGRRWASFELEPTKVIARSQSLG